MKTFLFANLRLVSFFYLIRLIGAKEPAYLVEVTKSTSLLERPSARSEKLADAEAGTTLLYLGKSRMGTWVKLQDSDGLKGWVPTDRTDYSEIKNQSDQFNKIQEINEESAVADHPSPSKEEMMDEILQYKHNESKTIRKFRIAPLMRWTSESEPASTRLGLRGDYALTPLAWASAEISFPSPHIKSHSSDISAALRYVMKTKLWGPSYYGPDFGYSLDKLEDGMRHHFAFGLTGGVVVGPIDFALRVGYDAFAHSRTSAEIQLGVSF